jgi:hypothetical protein
MCERSPKQYGQSDFDQGSFSTGGVWDSRFVYKIPDNMASEDAAPLLCGGWTIWNALIGYDLKPTDHVGIVGKEDLAILPSSSPTKWDVKSRRSLEQRARKLILWRLEHITSSSRILLKEKVLRWQDQSTNCLFAPTLITLRSYSHQS